MALSQGLAAGGIGRMQLGRRFSLLTCTLQASRTFWQHTFPQMIQSSPEQQSW
jgi:hypothetical protein